MQVICCRSGVVGAMLGIYWEDFGAIGADIGAISVYVGSILVQFWEVLGCLGRHTSGSVFVVWATGMPESFSHHAEAICRPPERQQGIVLEF